MKFYNPFKPHIAKVDGNKYAIRKSMILYWAYLDVKDWVYWWGDCESVRKWCTIDSEAEAINLLQRYHKHKKLISEYYADGSNK